MKVNAITGVVDLTKLIVTLSKRKIKKIKLVEANLLLGVGQAQ